jgi:hypothetical protein
VFDTKLPATGVSKLLTHSGVICSGTRSLPLTGFVAAYHPPRVALEPPPTHRGRPNRALPAAPEPFQTAKPPRSPSDQALPCKPALNVLYSVRAAAGARSTIPPRCVRAHCGRFASTIRTRVS